jgi:hypothetical protein
VAEVEGFSMTYMAQVAVPSFEEVRTARRRVVDFTGMVREANATIFRVQVSDVSTDGCRFRSDEQLETATTVWLKIAGETARQARIVWKRAGEYGCEFISPMHAEALGDLCSAKSQALRNMLKAKGTGFGRATPR